MALPRPQSGFILVRREVEEGQSDFIHLVVVDVHDVLVRWQRCRSRWRIGGCIVAGPTVVPMLQQGRPSLWAKKESSPIIVLERFDCQTSIIPSWQCSTASGHRVRAAFTNMLSMVYCVVLLGTAPRLQSTGFKGTCGSECLRSDWARQHHQPLLCAVSHMKLPTRVC